MYNVFVSLFDEGGNCMAGNDQKKGQKNVERIVPGLDTGKSSRVSKAAGSIGSSRTRVEQRSTPSRSRAASNGRSNNQGQASSRRVAGSKVTPRKGPAAGSMLPPTADSRLINQARDRWSDLQPHEQQRLFGAFLLVLSLFLFLALTFWRTWPLLRPLTDFFY